MSYTFSKAFTMMELVFVIVVIGILSAIAVPKLAATRDDAVITNALNTISSVRNALATEKQKRFLRGDFNTTLSAPSASEIFTIKMGGTETQLLSYDVKHCPSSGTKSECWERGSTVGEFIYYDPANNSCKFKINNGRFTRDASACSVPEFDNL